MPVDPIASATPASTAPSATLLFVDDESNILSALKRLFRPQGYTILTATSGAEGLDILGRENVDLVVSDMRMPEMDGAQFLEQVRLRWPQVVRILLTGYADIGSTITAINRGEIYRYIAKPWEDMDMLLAIHHALEQQRLRREKERLEALAQTQNIQLKELNATLEAKVRAQTAELQQAMQMLETAHADLKKGYLAAVKVFAHLIELREGNESGHCRRVAEHARALARALGFGHNETQDLVFAALLHEIGKIGLPDSVTGKPFVLLSSPERKQFMQYPVIGESALLGLEALHGAAKLIRAHQERFDGKGFPDALSGEDIPLGARALALANDYEALQEGKLVEGKLGPAEARAFLHTNSGQRYDPRLVSLFLPLAEQAQRRAPNVQELRLSSDDLREGMVLARDLISAEGILLLSKGQELKSSLIERIRNLERKHQRGYTLHIHPDGGQSDV